MSEPDEIEGTCCNLRVCENGHAEPIPGTEQKVIFDSCPACKKYKPKGDNFCCWCGERQEVNA